MDQNMTPLESRCPQCGAPNRLGIFEDPAGPDEMPQCVLVYFCTKTDDHIVRVGQGAQAVEWE